MRREAFFELLPVTLTPLEADERAHEAAGVIKLIQDKGREIDVFTEETKAKKKNLENAKALLEAKAYGLAEAVKSRMEPRQVACREVFNVDKVDTVREDTGEVVSSRAATRAEIDESLQVTLFPKGAPKKEGALAVVTDGSDKDKKKPS
jgi:hypothetical protein